MVGTADIVLVRKLPFIKSFFYREVPLYSHTVYTVQWNLSYPGSVGPRGARNFKIARNSELIHELCTYSTWLYKNTG